MWLTHSKNASKPVRQQAASIAAHLPMCRFITRSERPLARLELLAARAGINTLLVLQEGEKTGGKQGTLASGGRKERSPDPFAVLRARRKTLDGEGRIKWVWDEKELRMNEIKLGQKAKDILETDTPIAFTLKAAEAKKLAAFFGFEDELLAKIYAEPQEIVVSAAKKNAKIGRKKTQMITFAYRWGRIC